MKKMISILAALGIAASLSAMQVVNSPEKPQGCERLGAAKAGDIFATMSKETAIKAVQEDAKAMHADKVFLNVTSYTHPKLGKRYTAKAVAWKCS